MPQKNDEGGVHGALLIDKPAGITSADVLRRLKQQTGFRGKLGHAGTLDPFATGLLVVLLGKGARLQSIFQGAAKDYRGLIRLGIATDTEDITGTVIAATEDLCHAADPETVSRLQQQFLGRQSQVPPRYSALKLQGVRSYVRARNGEEFDLPAREVNIHSLQLVFETRANLAFNVSCSKGTYVRSLARDIGAALGVPACLAELCRVASHPFALSDAAPLDALERGTWLNVIKPMERLTADLPQFPLEEQNLQRLRLGDQRGIAELWSPGPTAHAALVDHRGAFAGLVEKHGALPDKWRVSFLM